MKALVLCAETASAHPDGTVSILRAGITHCWNEKPPVPLQGVLVVRIEGDIGDQGPHGLDLRWMDADGAPTAPPLNAQFVVPQGGGVVQLILGFGIAFQKTGRYVIVLRIDNHEMDRWNLTVTQGQKPKEGTP